jgi:hypothetical protein
LERTGRQQASGSAEDDDWPTRQLVDQEKRETGWQRAAGEAQRVKGNTPDALRHALSA